MERLRELENQSLFIIREAYQQFRKVAILWSMGKDSTTLIWLARKAFFGTIPFPVLHLDTSYKYKQMYEFRDRYAKRWHLNLRVIKNEKELTKGMGPGKGRLQCCNALKTHALQQALKVHGFRALYLAIRRDEHGIRAKERIFSPRNALFRWDYLNQPAELWHPHQTLGSQREHLRVHPLLAWREVDVWNYIRRERIPVPDLYFANRVRKNRRWRSIGCECCCEPVESKADTIDKIIGELRRTDIPERSGRAQDKEHVFMMEKLRALGYM